MNLVLLLHILELEFVFPFAQLRNEVKKLDEKLTVTENLLEHKVGRGLTIVYIAFLCGNKVPNYSCSIVTQCRTWKSKG